jgi:hypothetical protein
MEKNIILKNVVVSFILIHFIALVPGWTLTIFFKWLTLASIGFLTTFVLTTIDLIIMED